MIELFTKVLEQNPGTPPRELASVLWSEVLDTCPLLYQLERGDTTDLEDVFYEADLNGETVIEVHMELMLPDTRVFRKVGDVWEEVL